VRVVWSQYAIEDRTKIFEYLVEKNPVAAVECDAEIGRQIGSLIDFPEIGRIGRVKGTKELVVSGTPFIVVYLLDEREIRVLRILHAAQMWPGD